MGCYCLVCKARRPPSTDALATAAPTSADGRIGGSLASANRIHDNRSGVQLAAAQGNAKNFDFNLFGGIFGGGLGGGAGGFTNTPEGKIITAAFMDSYNQLVQAVRNYNAQTVKGGLGKGGSLKVGQ